MRKQVDNHFTWVIQNFSSLQFEKTYSDQFFIGGCKWRLLAYPKGICAGYLSLFLEVVDHGSLPSGWRRHARYRLTIVNQIQEKLSQSQENKRWFDRKCPTLGFTRMFPLAKLYAKDSGFLMNGEVRIRAEIDVVEVIGKLDESKECKETAKPLKKIKLNETNDQPLKKIKLPNDGAVSSDLPDQTTQQVNESVDVNGFLVLPSRVESVKRIFERHPEIASEVCTKSKHLRTAYINAIVDLIETLCKPLEELCDDDLNETSAKLLDTVNAGFKLDWLEKKLHQVLQNKKRVQSGEARLPEMEGELVKLNKKCSDLREFVENEKAEITAAKIRLSFDDIV